MNKDKKQSYDEQMQKVDLMIEKAWNHVEKLGRNDFCDLCEKLGWEWKALQGRIRTEF